MQLVQFTLHNALTKWNLSAFPVFMVALAVAVGAWYLSAEWKLALRGRRWPVHRTVTFFAGLVAFVLSFCSSVAVFAASYFQAHVIQHLALMVVAPGLLALGAPSTLLLQTGNRRLKQKWLAVLRSRPFAAISHPVVVWFLYFGLMYVFFLTPLINVAMHHMALMDVLNLVFFFSGTLYWWPMVGIDPIIHWKMTYGMRLLNLLLGSAVEAFLGVAILAASRPEASMYSISSTHSGGALLWVATELSTLGGFLPIFLQWAKSEERAGARADSRADARAAQLIPVAVALPGPTPGPVQPGDPAGEVADQSGEVADQVAARAGAVAGARRVPANAWEAAWLAKFGQLPGGTVPDPAPR